MRDNLQRCSGNRSPPPIESRRHAKRPPRSAGKVPSFVYRQEVFELSIVASSIAHAHEEADRRLTISHKHTTWAKVGARNAQQRAIRQPSSQAGNEKATRSSPSQQKKALRSSRRLRNRKPPGRNSNNSTRATARARQSQERPALHGCSWQQIRFKRTISPSAPLPS